MSARRISDAMLRVRDALYEGLLLRQGLVLTEEVARERANNLSTAVVELLRQMADEARATPAEVHGAMQDAPHDGSLFRQARAAIAALEVDDPPPPVRRPPVEDDDHVCIGKPPL